MRKSTVAQRSRLVPGCRCTCGAYFLRLYGAPGLQVLTAVGSVGEVTPPSVEVPKAIQVDLGVDMRALVRVFTSSCTSLNQDRLLSLFLVKIRKCHAHALSMSPRRLPHTKY